MEYTPGALIKAFQDYEYAQQNDNSSELDLARLRKNIKDIKKSYINYVEKIFGVKVEWE